VEGGITVILTLMILFGVVVGAVALFGAGGWLRRELQDEHDEEGRQRPQHTVVDNETGDVPFPRQPSTGDSAQPSRFT
jgi:hypothetical protein